MECVKYNSFIVVKSKIQTKSKSRMKVKVYLMHKKIDIIYAERFVKLNNNN